MINYDFSTDSVLIIFNNTQHEHIETITKVHISNRTGYEPHEYDILYEPKQVICDSKYFIIPLEEIQKFETKNNGMYVFSCGDDDDDFPLICNMFKMKESYADIHIFSCPINVNEKIYCYPNFYRFLDEFINNCETHIKLYFPNRTQSDTVRIHELRLFECTVIVSSRGWKTNDDNTFTFEADQNNILTEISKKGYTCNDVYLTNYY